MTIRQTFIKFLSRFSAPRAIAAERHISSNAVKLPTPMDCFWFENATELRMVMEDGTLNIYKLSTDWDITTAQFSRNLKTPLSSELKKDINP